MSLNGHKIALLICDVQERFRTLIPEFQDIVNVSSRLLYASHLFKFPVIVTEQNPAKLGKTVPELDLFPVRKDDNNNTVDQNTQVFTVSKMKFSMLTDQVNKIIKDNNIKVLILCGLETHVCILQTALEALKANLQVWLMCDGIGSRFPVDKDASLGRMQSEGVIMSTSEAFLFQLMESAEHPMFRSIVEILKRT